MDFIFYITRKFKYHINTMQLKNILYVRDVKVYKINIFMTIEGYGLRTVT